MKPLHIYLPAPSSAVYLARTEKANTQIHHARDTVENVSRGFEAARCRCVTGALPGRLVRNPNAIGLEAGRTDVPPASPEDTDGPRADLKQYAVEISRDGGASAVARVLRDDQERPVDEKAKL